MKVETLDIPSVRLITPRIFRDARGFFSETYNAEALAAAGVVVNFVQDNHSLSLSRGVIRGLHFQVPPKAQDKLVRVVRGAIFDVAVDIRKGSPTFGQHVSSVLSDRNWSQMLVPVGFAHGFCTLEPNTEVIYKVSAPYDPELERGIRWDDPSLAVPWPVDANTAILSEKDSRNPGFAELPPIFTYST